MFDNGTGSPEPNDHPADGPAASSEMPDLDAIDTLGFVADQVAALECAVRLELVRHIAALDAAGAPKADGQSSLANWVGLRFGFRAGTAREIATVAAVIDTLPALAAAFGEGAISWDQLVPLCGLADPSTDTDWAGAGPNHTPEALRQMARIKRQADITPKTIHDKRRVTIRPQPDGTTRTTIIGEPTDTERLAVLLDRIREAEAVADPDTGRYPSVAQQRYDALISLLRRELAQDNDVDRATIVIHTDLELLTGDNPNGAATTPDGTSIAAETVRRYCCDGRIEWAIDGPDGTTLGIGRASRVWPPWLSRLIRHRDQHCRFPGCPHPIHEIHHIAHWAAHRGPTDDTNGIGLCWTHHHDIHEGGWTVTGNPNAEVTFTSPHGRELPETRPRRLTPHVKRRMQGTTPGLFQPTDDHPTP